MRIRVRGAARVQRAIRGAWWRRQRTWWSTCFRRWQCGSWLWCCRSACGTFYAGDASCVNWVVGIAMRAVQRAAGRASTAVAACTGGVLVVHPLGAALNAHLHLCLLDVVIAPGRHLLAFHAAQADAACVEHVQAAVRQRELWLFVRRGLVSWEMVAVMQPWGPSGDFSVPAGVRWWRHRLTGGRRLGAGSKVPRPKTVRAVADCGQAGHPARYLWAQLLARS